MRIFKGQSDIIAVVLIVLLAIALLGVAYTFGLPYINKTQDESIELRVKAAFSPTNSNSLPAKLQSVANSGSRDSAAIDVTGVTRLYAGPSDPGIFVGIVNNTIEFSFQSTVTSNAEDKGWISLTGAACPPGPGIIGVDDVTVICARADTTTGGRFNITYRMYVRELEDAEKKNGFAINLLQHPSSSNVFSGSKSTIRMEFDDRRTVTVGAKTLIITDVKILLV